MVRQWGTSFAKRLREMKLMKGGHAKSEQFSDEASSVNMIRT